MVYGNTVRGPSMFESDLDKTIYLKKNFTEKPRNNSKKSLTGRQFTAELTPGQLK